MISKPYYLLFPLLFLSLFPCPSLSKKSTFIVYMIQSEKPTAFSSTHDWYSSILKSVSYNTSTQETPNLLYTYANSATGFSAHMLPTHANKLRDHPAVLAVIPDQIVEATTTKSPEFLGLFEGSGIWPETNKGSDIIIGVIDTGIWPENPSFYDHNIHGKPARWKGGCESAPDFSATSCNNKLIGARSFYKGYEAKYGPLKETKSPRDYNGHGSHCASIAGGSAFKDAGYYQYAKGQASGVAPLAHIAAYKVLWGENSKSSVTDLLAAMDQAIEDGVDVISMSIGPNKDDIFKYDQDPIAIGAFRAMHRGVVVSVSASNHGPDFLTVKNFAPWMLTVGASTINRFFPADVVLRDGPVLQGLSVYNYPQPTTLDLMLVTGEAAHSIFCKPDCNKPGAVCEDPRFIGADGITFYFHGKKDQDFCLVTDPNLHINAHFIGKRDSNMGRDFTWVQSLGILFDNHKLYIGAQKTATWNDALDRLSLSYDDHPINLLETEGASWKSTAGGVTITRSKPTNAVEVEAEGKFKIKAVVVPITDKDSLIHKYGITPQEDCFAHLDLSFKFNSLSDEVNGVLGQTYGSNYTSRVKMGVANPVLGGDKEFHSSSMFATDCAVARFSGNGDENEGHSYEGIEFADLNCASGISGSGVVCKR